MVFNFKCKNVSCYNAHFEVAYEKVIRACVDAFRLCVLESCDRSINSRFKNLSINKMFRESNVQSLQFSFIVRQTSSSLMCQALHTFHCICVNFSSILQLMFNWNICEHFHQSLLDSLQDYCNRAQHFL